MLNDKRSDMEKERILHIMTTLLFCGLLLNACQQEELPDVNQTDEIHFQPGEHVFTRGLIEGLAAEGTKITLYGYKGNNFLAAGKEKELSGKSLTYNNESWFVVDDNENPLTYFWEEEGSTYRFFGWLKRHGESNPVPNAFTPSFNSTTKQCSIPELVVNTTSNQFDFLYSDVDERVLNAQNKLESVQMNMHHLFTAFGIGFSNTSEDTVYIKKITLNGLHNKGLAVIDYSQTPAVITYNTSVSGNSQTTPFFQYTAPAGGIKVPKGNGAIYNLLDPSSAEKEFYMVWPQQAEVVSPELDFANEEEEAATPDYMFPLVLEYTVDGNEFKKRAKFPEGSWEAGKKHYFDVLVADKLLEIKATVTDWDYTTSSVDFSESAVVVKENNHLTWDSTTCIVENSTDANGKRVDKVYVKNGQPVEATFTIDAPAGGQWRVSLEGDVQAFTILDDSEPTNDGFGPIDSKQHRIRIVPTVSNPDRDYSVTLKFVAITVDSKTYAADDMVQDYDNDDKADVHTIVLQSVQ